jgi:D-amino-acid dehydrogenase
MARTESKRIAVIGAGVVGMSAALHLQADGHAVTVIDGRAPGRATSFGNAGAIVGGAVLPTSTPGLWKDVPGMLSDPMSPLKIRWSYLPRLAPWMIRFLRAGTPRRVEEISRALEPLVSRALDHHQDLLRRTRIDGIVKPVGWLKVYESERSFQGSAYERGVMERRGRPFDVLNEDEIRQLEPALARRFQRAVFQPESNFVADPGGLVAGYADCFAAAGGRFMQSPVRRLEPREGGSPRVVTEHGFVDFDRVVIAAGAWSALLARQLGERVPLDTERGYHLNLDPEGAGELRRPTVFVDRKFVLAPMNDGIRLTSGVEFAGLDAEPDFTRIYRLLPAAREVLPGLGDRVTREWMGRRPSTPDSLPVIGPSTTQRGVVYAFGHGHLGLTLGPLTGRLVADIVAQRDAGFDLTPYRAGRFG